MLRLHAETQQQCRPGCQRLLRQWGKISEISCEIPGQHGFRPALIKHQPPDKEQWQETDNLGKSLDMSAPVKPLN